MPCTRCNGVCVNDQFYDRVDEQGQLRLARIIHECRREAFETDARGGFSQVRPT